MHRVKAMEKLEDGEYCSKLTMDGLYRLLKTAGHSEEDAQKAAREHGFDRLSNGLSA